MKLRLETHEIMIDLCWLYCDAKPFYWKWFFGWRKTNSKGSYFRIGEKAYQEILKLAYKWDEYEIL